MRAATVYMPLEWRNGRAGRATFVRRQCACPSSACDCRRRWGRRLL